MGLEDEIGWQESECLSVPVDPPAADAIHRHERAPSADRQGLFAHLVAKGEGRLLGAQKKLMAYSITQFVLNVGGGKIRWGVPPWAALNRDDVETLVGQLLRQDRARPAEAYDRNVLAGELLGHR